MQQKVMLLCLTFNYIITTEGVARDRVVLTYERNYNGLGPPKVEEERAQGRGRESGQAKSKYAQPVMCCMSIFNDVVWQWRVVNQRVNMLSLYSMCCMSIVNVKPYLYSRGTLERMEANL